jgi:hypothetical protein
MWILIFFFIVSFSYWTIRGYVTDWGGEFRSIFKAFYGYFFMLFLVNNIAYIKKYQLVNYIILFGILSSISMFIAYLGGIAVYKYGADFSFGIKGLFIAGNDLGLALLMCNCLACYMFVETSRMYYAIANIVISIAAISLGTVAGLFGTSFIMGMFILTGIWTKNTALKIRQKFYFAILTIIAIPVLYNVIQYITTIDSYNIDKFSTERLLSGGARNGLIELAIREISTFNISDIIWGRGSSQMYFYMGVAKMENKMMGIEVDHYEMFYSYGILLGGMLILIPILVAIHTFKQYFKYRTNYSFWNSIALLLFLIHAFTAGHSYANVMAMPIVSALYYCLTYYERNSNVRI